MLKAFKVRLYPNKTQETLIAKTIGCCRAVKNAMLYENKQAYAAFKAEEEGMTDEQKKSHKFTHKINYAAIAHKPGMEFLKEVSARALNYEQQNTKTAFNNFFKGSNRGVGFPQFAKKTYEGSFQDDSIKVVGHKLKLPKCAGLVQFRNYKEVDFSAYKTKTITISRNAAGKYFASILCEMPDEQPLPKTGKSIGIDLGVKTAVTFDDGRKIERPNTMKIQNIREEIAFLQGKLAKAGVWTDEHYTDKDGKQQTKRKLVQKTGNYIRLQKRIALLTDKLYNMRNNFITTTAKKVVETADVICMEDLNIANEDGKGMLADDENKSNKKNATTHRNIAEASMGMIGTRIVSMAQMYGRTVVQVNPANTSRTCHCCGFVKPSMGLDIREWNCPNCGKFHDRDVNAAINILNRGLKKLA